MAHSRASCRWSRVARLLAGAMLCAALVAGFEARAQRTLSETMALAYQTNPQLSAERARLRASDEDVARALGGWRPAVSVLGEYGRAKDNLSTTVLGRTTNFDQYRNPARAELSLRQPIYDGGRTPAEVERSEESVLRGRELLRSTEQSVLLDAVVAHVAVYRDQRIVELDMDNLAAVKRQREIVDRRRRVQDATETDVAQAEVRLARAISELRLAQGNLESSQSNYFRIVGAPAGPNLVAPPYSPGAPGSLENARSRVKDNPDVNAALILTRVASADIDVVRAGLLPNLSVRAGLRHSDELDTPEFTRDTAELIVSLTVPIYEQGIAAAQTRGAKHTEGQRRLEYRQTLDRAIDLINRTWENLQTSRARLVSLQREITAGRIAVDAVEKEVRIGTRTTIDLLDQLQELNVSEIAKARAEYDAVSATYQLQATVGQLSAKNLGLAVEVYDPVAHYDKTRDRWFGTGIDVPYEKVE